MTNCNREEINENGPGCFRLSCFLLLAVCVACGTAPERTFTEADLLIEEGAIPDGWTTTERIDNTFEEEGEESAAYVTFQYDNTQYLARGGETLYRYGSSGRAARHYRRMFKSNFEDTNPRSSAWLTPKEFAFTSSVADQSHFACAVSTFTIGPQTGNSSHICVFLAQYDEFLVYASITTQRDSEEFIAIGEVAAFITSIDRQMANHLGSQ